MSWTESDVVIDHGLIDLCLNFQREDSSIHFPQSVNEDLDLNFQREHSSFHSPQSVNGNLDINFQREDSSFHSLQSVNANYSVDFCRAQWIPCVNPTHSDDCASPHLPDGFALIDDDGADLTLSTKTENKNVPVDISSNINSDVLASTEDSLSQNFRSLSIIDLSRANQIWSVGVRRDTLKSIDFSPVPNSSIVLNTTLLKQADLSISSNSFVNGNNPTTSSTMCFSNMRSPQVEKDSIKNGIPPLSVPEKVTDTDIISNWESDGASVSFRGWSDSIGSYLFENLDCETSRQENISQNRINDSNIDESPTFNNISWNWNTRTISPMNEATKENFVNSTLPGISSTHLTTQCFARDANTTNTSTKLSDSIKTKTNASLIENGNSTLIGQPQSLVPLRNSTVTSNVFDHLSLKGPVPLGMEMALRPPQSSEFLQFPIGTQVPIWKPLFDKTLLQWSSTQTSSTPLGFASSLVSDRGESTLDPHSLAALVIMHTHQQLFNTQQQNPYQSQLQPEIEESSSSPSWNSTAFSSSKTPHTETIFTSQSQVSSQSLLEPHRSCSFLQQVGLSQPPPIPRSLSRPPLFLTNSPSAISHPPPGFSSTTSIASEGFSSLLVSRSQLLEEFRNSTSRFQCNPLNCIEGHIVEFARDQHGSRYIQQKLENATVPEKNSVFFEIIPHASQLMTDVFGNYVIQKFFEFGTVEQKESLALSLRGHVVEFSMQMYGCRVIQKALESVLLAEKVRIIDELRPCVMRCVKDQNGNHVIQKCIECVPPSELDFIISAFRNQVLLLSSHPYGCRVIQRVLEYCLPEQTHRILDEMHRCLDNLIKGQYGNYVVQHVLEHGSQEDKSRIINSLHGRVSSLSSHKFASNVVEKAIVNATPAERKILVSEVLELIDCKPLLSEDVGFVETGSSTILLEMMKDQYANYVVQRMLELADPQQRQLLLTHIRPLQNTLRNYNYGKHIITKLDKYGYDGPTSVKPANANEQPLTCLSLSLKS